LFGTNKKLLINQKFTARVGTKRNGKKLKHTKRSDKNSQGYETNRKQKDKSIFNGFWWPPNNSEAILFGYLNLENMSKFQKSAENLPAI
jgi:hypothetical protein